MENTADMKIKGKEHIAKIPYQRFIHHLTQISGNHKQLIVDTHCNLER